MADLVLRKRGALHAGELGLFLDTEVFADEFASIGMGVDLEVKATQPRSLKQMRFIWALARKVAQSGVLGDVDQREAMDYLLLKARHVRYVTTTFRGGVDTIPVVKSIRFAAMDQTLFQRLVDRIVYIVTAELIPGMPESQFRAEVEAMAGVSSDPTPPRERAPRKPRAPKPEPEKVSVIPPADHDPVTGEVIEPSAGVVPPAPAETPVPSPPAAQEKAAAPAPDPTTVAGWQAFAAAWLAEYRSDPTKTEGAVAARWAGERGLRNRCGVTDTDRAENFATFQAILAEKAAAAQ